MTHLEDITKSEWKALCARIEIPIKSNIAWIGEGCSADIFDLNDGRVLKITTDLSDAAGSLLFKNKPSSVVVDIYDAFKIKEADNESHYDLYGIVAQKLNPLTPDWEEFAHFCDKYISSGKPSKVFSHLTQILTKVQARRFKTKIAWLEKVSEEFANRNLNWNDFHAGNILREGRHQVKVIDLGHSFPNRLPNVPPL
jgi:hypothetical protein